MRYTVKPSVPDLRDHIKAAPKGYATAPVSLGVTVPFRDQGQEGSCGGFATTSALSAYLLKHGHPYEAFAPAFAYWNARLIEGTTGQDSGTTIQDEMKALTAYGAAPEVAMPYVAGQFRTPPSAEAVAEGKQTHAVEYFRVPHARGGRDSLSAMRHCAHALAVGLPLIIGISVYQSFEDAFGQGIIPMPRAGEAMLGGHALYCHTVLVDAGLPGGGALVGDNSWGNSQPFALPFAYITDTRLTWEVRTFTL